MVKNKILYNNILTKILHRKYTSYNNLYIENNFYSENLYNKTINKFEKHPLYRQLLLMESAAQHFHIGTPFFKIHEGQGGAHTIINGESYCNYSH